MLPVSTAPPTAATPPVDRARAMTHARRRPRSSLLRRTMPAPATVSTAAAVQNTGPVCRNLILANAGPDRQLCIRSGGVGGSHLRGLVDDGTKASLLVPEPRGHSSV